MNFEFQLVITEKCNLACTYCYMDHTPTTMTSDCFDAHYKFMPNLMHKFGHDKFNLVFFGGEPTLNWDLIEYITPIVRNDPRCGMILLLTNGLELEDDYKRQYLQKMGIGFSLSFDGLWNKTTRPLANGRSSLDRYMDLKPIFSNGSNGCKVMISPDNVSTMSENYKFFVEEYDMPFPDFSLVRDDVWDDNSIAIFERESRKVADMMISYIRQGKHTMVGYLRLYMMDLVMGAVQGKRPFGCFTGCHGAAFMPDGNIYPCARFGSEKKFQLGNSYTQTLTDNLKVFEQPIVTNPSTFEKCQGCELYQYCNAGCTFEQLKNGNDKKAVPLDSICQLLKIGYRDAMYVMEQLKHNKDFKMLFKQSFNSMG